MARNESFEKQARSAQTNGAATSYINTIVNSKSITEAISRVAAMSEIVSANNKMLEQQKADKKKSIAEKQVANNEAINTVIANQQTLADDAQALTTKQAELKVAELNLAAEKATAESDKATLLEQKAAAEAEAKAAAEAEAAYKARQTSQQQSVVASGNTTLSDQKCKRLQALHQMMIQATLQHLLQLQLDSVQHTVQMLQVIQLVNVLGELRH